MSWHIYLILGVCGVASLLALYVVFRRDSGLTSSQAKEVEQSYRVETEEHKAAEAKEEQQLAENTRQAQTDLRALAAQEQSVPEPWVGQTNEEVEREAEAALSRWNEEKLNSPLPVGVYLAMVLWWWLFYATIACAAPSSQPAKLTTTQRLIKALNQCTFSRKRLRVEHLREMKDASARCQRKVEQRDAKIKRLQSELLVYRKKPKGNRALIITISVVGTIAALALGVAVTAVAFPELYGNRRAL